MSYEKQTWNKYDGLKTEEENIENGAVVTDNRMNHMESGIGDNDANLASHLANTNNPHKVTAAQVGLGNVQNFGLATEDEAKQGISNAKYMTPSLTQAVLSANINSIAHANSADGTDGFTTIYPNLNLLDGTKDFSGDWINGGSWTNDGTYKGLVIKKRTGKGPGFYKVFTAPADGAYTFSSYLKSSGNGGNIRRWVNLNGIDGSGTIDMTSNFDWKIDTFSTTLKAGDELFVRYEVTSDGTGLDTWNAGHKLEQGSTATPYMPSSSEVTTADLPKYIGFSNTVKTNKSASDYTWFPVKDSELTNKVDSHIKNKANPHAVTASQVGAYSKQEIDTKLSNADSILGKVYPVGAYYFSSQSTEPATLFGFGTWSRVKGRGLVGVDESDLALSSGGKQGGSINPLSQHTIAPSSGQFIVSRGSGTSHWSSASAPSSSYAMDTEASGITVGDNTNHNNWQPFEAAYIWKRTA